MTVLPEAFTNRLVVVAPKRVTGCDSLRSPGRRSGGLDARQEVAQPRCGLEAELRLEQGPIPLELLQRVGLIAFREMHADHGSAGALSERIGTNSRERRSTRVAEATHLDEPLGKRFERRQA